MRQVYFQNDIIEWPQGSCLAVFGKTRVVCTATVEERVPPFLEGTGKGWLTAEYAMLPGSTSGGRKRRALLKPDSRGTEIQRLIGRSLRACLDLEKLGPFTITIDCDVLQADGGTRTAAISGGWVALCLAVNSMKDTFKINGIHDIIKGRMAAVSVGKFDDEIVCDLDYAHDSAAQVDMNIVFLDDCLVEVQGTGEKGTFTRSQLNAMIDSAEEGIRIINKAQEVSLGSMW